MGDVLGQAGHLLQGDGNTIGSCTGPGSWCRLWPCEAQCSSGRAGVPVVTSHVARVVSHLHLRHLHDGRMGGNRGWPPSALANLMWECHRGRLPTPGGQHGERCRHVEGPGLQPV